MIDALLKKFNAKYEDLNDVERETFNNWLNVLQDQQKAISVESIKEYVISMRESVDEELSSMVSSKDRDKEKENNLKARLRNYILLQAFLTTPEKARKQLEKVLDRIK